MADFYKVDAAARSRFKVDFKIDFKIKSIFLNKKTRDNFFLRNVAERRENFIAKVCVANFPKKDFKKKLTKSPILNQK